MLFRVFTVLAVIALVAAEVWPVRSSSVEPLPPLNEVSTSAVLSSSVKIAFPFSLFMFRVSDRLLEFSIVK